MFDGLPTPPTHTIRRYPNKVNKPRKYKQHKRKHTNEKQEAKAQETNILYRHLLQAVARAGPKDETNGLATVPGEVRLATPHGKAMEGHARRR